MGPATTRGPGNTFQYSQITESAYNPALEASPAPIQPNQASRPFTMATGGFVTVMPQVAIRSAAATGNVFFRSANTLSLTIFPGL